MGETKKIKQKLERYRQVIQEHETKITEEQHKPNPDYGLTRHWEAEIKAHRQIIDRLERRLKVRRRRG